MRILVFITLLSIFWVPLLFASTPDLIRIRTFKNLNEFPEIQNSKIEKINEVAWRVSGAKLYFQGKRLAEKNVILKRADKFEIVSVIPFNDYLSGVVASEMPVTWPLEALKAQAVVARSFTLARLKEKKPSYYDMEADESDQMFSVTTSEKAFQAVFQTDGFVLQDINGRTLKAYYHSDCGGQTVSANEIWGGGGLPAGTATDSWCLLRKSNRWTYEIPKDEFFRKLGFSDWPNEPFDLVWKSRAQKFSLLGSIFSVQKIREIFGFSKIKSTPTLLEIGEKIVKVSGQGFGHGAGLCQWGTRSQAENGTGFKEVLSHYYPMAHLSVDKLKLAAYNRESRLLFAVSN
jgi:stage II sporulation protein D